MRLYLLLVFKKKIYFGRKIENIVKKNLKFESFSRFISKSVHISKMATSASSFKRTVLKNTKAVTETPKVVTETPVETTHHDVAPTHVASDVTETPKKARAPPLRRRLLPLPLLPL